MEQSTHVGIGQVKIVKAPNNLHTLGIGSCIVLYLYSDEDNFGGCAHIMLPSSKAIKKESVNPSKFADTAIPYLIDALNLQGFSTDKLKAKYVGGAQMFGNDSQNVGPKNIEAVEQVLKELNIPIVTFDIGGNKGRSAFFSTTTKEIKIIKIDCDDFYI